MLACNRSLWAKISSIKRQSGAGGVGIALCTNSALSIQDLQGDNGSFLSRSPRLYQPELWQFNLFSVFQHELWMNPATSECGGDLRWSSSLLLRNSSFLCQRLGVDLKEVREREKNQGNLQRIKAEYPVNMPLLPRWQTSDWLLGAETH